MCSPSAWFARFLRWMTQYGKDAELLEPKAYRLKLLAAHIHQKAELQKLVQD
jgi:hypothetical protein